MYGVAPSISFGRKSVACGKLIVTLVRPITGATFHISMQTTVCPFCKQPIEDDSKLCQHCGAFIDPAPLFLKQQRGKRKLYAVFAAIMGAFILLSYRSVFSSSLIHTGFVVLLLFFIYRGHWWAKTMLLIIMTGVSLTTCLLLTLILLEPWSSLLYSITMISALALFCSSGFILLKSDDVKVFLESQARKNQDDPVLNEKKLEKNEETDGDDY
ncbi:MAG TPA: zinc ribbon domain-containing protein [Chloroflexota bacterium]|nr:zinc ribbon domain-containing protein [Chloroflexota bacterium]HUM72527.1 zinc ribbon domain-containing protein [Chloroflexota bacterium]